MSSGDTRAAALAYVILLGGGCTYGAPATPPAPIGDESFQSETALTTARLPGVSGVFSDTVVMSFNDFTVGNIGPDPEYLYFNSNSIVEVRRGSSAMGFSLGAPVPTGIAWAYGGKLHAPGWTIWVDPTAATDRTDTSTVYLAQLGISDDSWLTMSEGAEVIVGTDQVLAAVDGFCVARTTNAGVSFQIACHRVLSEPPIGVRLDKTAIAVDWSGRVWVAVEDRQATHPDPTETQPGSIRVFRSAGSTSTTWSQFTEVTIPTAVAHGLGNLEPRLKSDSNGDVFLQSVRVPPGVAGSTPYSLRLIQVAGPTGIFYGDVLNDIPGSCSIGSMKVGNAHTTIGTGTTAHPIKNAFRHDFAVGWSWITEAPVYRFAYVYPDAATADRVQVGEIDAGFSSCQQSPFLSTASWVNQQPNVGKQFQPALDFNVRNEPAAPLEWQMACLSTSQAVDMTDKYVAPWGVTLGDRTVGAQVVPAFVFMTPLVPALLTPQGNKMSWYACPESNGYWGDYFGLTQFYNPVMITPPFNPPGSWQNVAGFTDSRPASGPASGTIPCYWETPVLGQPQHVAGSAWLSIDLVP